MKQYDATIAGYLCIDMFPEIRIKGNNVSVSELFRPGRLIEIEGIKFSLGGAVANTGLAMKKFGKTVYLNSLIGRDHIGNVVLDLINSYASGEGIQITEKQVLHAV